MAGRLHRYIAQDNPRAADRVLEGIFARVQALQDYPRLGYSYRMESNGEVRVLVYGRYRIAYLLEEVDRVVVLGVFHGALDIDRYL